MAHGPAWVALAAPALSLCGHAAVLALAAMLVASRTHSGSGSSEDREALLAFDVVEVSDPTGERESASAVDEVPVAREGLAQGHDVRQPGLREEPDQGLLARQAAPKNETGPARTASERTLPAPDSSALPAGASEPPAPVASATATTWPAPSNSEPPGAAALAPPGQTGRELASAGERPATSPAPASTGSFGLGDPAATGRGGGPRRDRRPDVVERFNHDLPSLAFGVASWTGVSPGESGPVTIVLELDEQGQLGVRGNDALVADRCTSRAPSPVDARCARTRAAYESARRTVDGLYGRFELPGSNRGAGRVRLALVATVSGVATEAANDDALAAQPVEVGSTTITAERGRAHFVRAEGRRVDFALQILSVDSAAASPSSAGPPEPASAVSP